MGAAIIAQANTSLFERQSAGQWVRKIFEHRGHRGAQGRAELKATPNKMRAQGALRIF
jgi:hypothetical protein